MPEIVDYALQRLISLLPLAARQATLSPQIRKLHQSFLRSLVERGRPLTEAEVAAAAPGGDAFAVIWTLSALDLIVLGPDYRPVGAYPLTTEPTPHRVTVQGNTLWAMCALDAVAVAPLFKADVAIHSRCPVTGESIAIQMKGKKITGVGPGPEVQIGVWWREPGPSAAKNFCPGVTFLRDRAAAVRWQGDLPDRDFASLDDAVMVAARFFEPLLIETPAAVGVLA